jgi:hypothetical protein
MSATILIIGIMVNLALMIRLVQTVWWIRIYSDAWQTWAYVALGISAITLVLLVIALLHGQGWIAW